MKISGSALPSNTVSGGPVLCQTNSNGIPNPNQCYQPSPGDVLFITRTIAPEETTLSITPSHLALSVNDSSNLFLTGHARLITIKNTGINDAKKVIITYPIWPGGTPATTASSTCGPTLAAGATCIITITPGTNATSDCTTGIAPTLGTLTVSAANVATPITANVAVLGYGCIYQGGYIFSIDDTTNGGQTGTCTSAPCTGSIGGKVVSTTDQINPVSGIIWSSNGASGSSNYSWDTIPGIGEDSTTIPLNGIPAYDGIGTLTFSGMFTGGLNLNYSSPISPPDLDFKVCNGAIDGQCNTDNILLYYNAYKTGFTSNCHTNPVNCSLTPAPSPATSLSFYAAGVCSQYIDVDGYTNWHLPTTCNLDSVSYQLSCPIVPTPQGIIPNLQSLLVGTSGTPCSGPHCLFGRYWSSTESSNYAWNGAWLESFHPANSFPLVDVKNGLYGLRCVRDF